MKYQYVILEIGELLDSPTPDVYKRVFNSIPHDFLDIIDLCKSIQLKEGQKIAIEPLN